MSSAAFPLVNSHMWPGAVTLDYADKEYFHDHRKFYGTALIYKVNVNTHTLVNWLIGEKRFTILILRRRKMK